MSTRAAAGVVAGLLLVAGLIFGLVPQSVPDTSKLAYTHATVSCGSAFAPDDSKASLAQYGVDLGAALRGDRSDAQGLVQQCADARSFPRVAAWTLIGLGAIALLFLLLTMRTAARPVATDDAVQLEH